MHNDLSPTPLIFVNDIKITEDNIMKNAHWSEIIVSLNYYCKLSLFRRAKHRRTLLKRRQLQKFLSLHIVMADVLLLNM